MIEWRRIVDNDMNMPEHFTEHHTLPAPHHARSKPPCPPDILAQHVTHTSKLSVVCQLQATNKYKLYIMRTLGRHPIHHLTHQQ